MSTPEEITMVRNAIHNPAEPRHFMRIVPAAGSQVATIGDRVVARSDGAVLVKEVGRDVYDAVVYFPRADVDMDALSSIDKTTHCPLKGDTEYFDIAPGGDAGNPAAAAAWSYVTMIDVDGVDELQGRIAFDAGQVSVRAAS